MDVHFAAFVLFVAFLAAIIWRDRKRFTREFIFILRKTQRGKSNIIRLGREWPRFWKALGTIGVVFGFFMSVWIFYQMLMITARNIMVGGTPGLTFILPSPTAEAVVLPGVIGIPFLYFIIPLAILVIVHEGFHGIMAAMERVKIKSLGWGLLIILPLAFVEPDEEQLSRKPALSQLRVFAAGSFANFITAGIVFGIAYFFASGTLLPAGVSFSTYPATTISPDRITAVAGIGTRGLNQTLSVLRGLDRNITVSLVVDNETFYSKPWLLLRQENMSEWGVFKDLPAVKADLNGYIYRIGNWSISNTQDLRDVLNRIGPDKTITIETKNDTSIQTFTLTTVAEPLPVFRPNPHNYVMAGLEHIIPGVVDLEEYLYKSIGMLLGSPLKDDWRSLQLKRGFWEWAGKSYPMLKSRAEEKISQIDIELAQHPRGGYIGIMGVADHTQVRAELKPFKDVIYFFGGLLYWIFLINIGVGAFNLLPIRILDGGRMWEILLRRFFKKRYRVIIRTVSIFTTLIVLIAVFMILGSFLG